MMILKKKILLLCLLLTVLLSGCGKSNLSEDGVGYEIEGKSVFYNFLSEQGVLHKMKLSDVDISSFETLDYYYAKDKNNVFYELEKVPGADPLNFKPIKGNFAKDAHTVFYISEKIPEADPNTFQVETFIPLYATETERISNYGKDQSAVYWEKEKMLNSDPVSFEAFNYGFGKDKNTVYYEGKILKGLDSNSFSFVGISGDFVKDKNAVYTYTNGREFHEGDDPLSLLTIAGLEKMESIEDPSTFEIINTELTKDKNSIYWKGKKIEGAEIKSFELFTNNNLPTEENSSYSGYSKDKFHVFYENNIIPGVDIATFKVPYEKHAQDKNSEYERGKKINFFDINEKGYIQVKIFFNLDKNFDINPDTGELKSYWEAKENLVAVNRYIPPSETIVQDTLKLLLSGPSEKERKEGYSSEIPAEGDILSIQIINGEAIVDFNKSIEEGTSSIILMTIRENQLQKTLLQFPTVKSVKFSVEGRTKNIFTERGDFISP